MQERKVNTNASTLLRKATGPFAFAIDSPNRYYEKGIKAQFYFLTSHKQSYTDNVQGHFSLKHLKIGVVSLNRIN